VENAASSSLSLLNGITMILAQRYKCSAIFNIRECTCQKWFVSISCTSLNIISLILMLWYYSFLEYRAAHFDRQVPEFRRNLPSRASGYKRFPVLLWRRTQ
jgi:hypothetical protein